MVQLDAAFYAAGGATSLALAAALWAASLLTIPFVSNQWPLTAVLAVVAGLLTYRMYDFGVCYARELYLEFLVNDSSV